jgi:hypothetical protein
MSRSDWRVLKIAVVSIIVVIALLVAFDYDCSAAPYVLLDVMFRDSAAQPLPQSRFLDPSPYSIWLPSDLFVWRSIRSFHLPLWNATQGGGYSPLTSLQNGVMHPLRWLVAIVPLRQAASALLLLQAVLGFLGAFLAARHALRLSFHPALMTALIFLFSGFTLSFLYFSGALLPFVHSGWVLFGYDRFASARTGRSFAVLVLILASLFLSGHPLIIFSVALASTIYASLDLATRPERGMLLRLCLVALLLSLTMAAVLFVPVLMQLRDTWSYKTETAVGASYRVMDWPTWKRAVTWTINDAQPNLPAFDEPEQYSYFGPGVMLLALIGAISSLRSGVRNFAIPALFVIGFLLAFPAPLWSFAASIPGVSFCKPWYLFGIFALGVSLAAGIGFDVASRELAARKMRIVTLLVALMAILPLAGHSLKRVTFQPAPRFDGAALKFLQTHVGQARVSGLYGQTHLPNIGELTQLDDLRISGPFLSQRYVEWAETAAPGVTRRSVPTTLIPDRYDTTLLGAFAVKYIVVSRKPNLFLRTMLDPATTLAAQDYVLDAPPEGLRRVFQAPSVDIYEIEKGVRPRAWFATTVQPVATRPEAQAALMKLRADSTGTVVVEGSFAPISSNLSNGEAVKLEYPHDSAVRLEVTRNTPGLLVLNDLYDRGWRATLDGKAADILPVNLIARGVIVPRGTTW